MSRPQAGGVALLMAFLLLVLLSAGALASSRNVVREWENAGADLRRAQAFLAAESGLAWAWANLAALPPGPAWTFPPEGEWPLEGVPEARVRTSFRIRGHCLGTVVWPGEPERLETLWEITAEGLCAVGPPGPAALLARQTCRVWWACPVPGSGAGPRRLGWQYLKYSFDSI